MYIIAVSPEKLVSFSDCVYTLFGLYHYPNLFWTVEDVLDVSRLRFRDLTTTRDGGLRPGGIAGRGSLSKSEEK